MDGHRRRRRAALLAAATGALSLTFLDQTAVSVALPAIQDDLGASAREAAWVINIYVLALAVLIAAAGRLGDRLGTARVLAGGLPVFAGASVGCALAPDPGWLIAARAVQGAGAAGMLPLTTALISDAFGPHERGRALGLSIGIASAMLALGPLVGGAVTELASWPWIFALNVPLAALLAMIVLRTAAAADGATGAGPRPAGPPDPLGALLLVVGLGGLVAGLMQGPTWGWDAGATLALLGGGLIARAAFGRAERARTEPLLHLGLLRGPYLGAVLVAGAARFVVVGAVVYAAILLQALLDFGPLDAGLAMLTATIPILFAGPISGRLTDRRGAVVPATGGLLIAAAGLAWMAAHAGEARYGSLWPGLIALGLGLGLAVPAATTAGMNAVTERRRGEAPGLQDTARQVGGALGVAVLGALVTAVELDRLVDRLGRPAVDRHRATLDGLLVESGAEQARAARAVGAGTLDAARDALGAGMAAAFAVAAAVCALGAAVAVVLLRARAGGRSPP